MWIFLLPHVRVTVLSAVLKGRCGATCLMKKTLFIIMLFMLICLWEDYISSKILCQISSVVCLQRSEHAMLMSALKTYAGTVGFIFLGCVWWIKMQPLLLVELAPADTLIKLRSRDLAKIPFCLFMIIIQVINHDTCIIKVVVATVFHFFSRRDPDITLF